MSNGVTSCGICRKSIFDMTKYWKVLKKQIIAQPMPDEYNIINIGDIVHSPFGLFKITHIENNMYSGILNLTPTTKATFNKKCLKQMVNIYCNDCGKKSKSPHHFIGNECLLCGSYNTF